MHLPTSASLEYAAWMLLKHVDMVQVKNTKKLSFGLFQETE